MLEKSTAWVAFAMLWGWFGGVRGLLGTPLSTMTKKYVGDRFFGTPNGDHFGITFDENSMNKSMAKSKPKNYEQI